MTADRPALTLRQHGVLALVVAASLEDRAPIRPNACRLAAHCADVGPRVIAREVEALVAMGVLIQTPDGRIGEPDVLDAIDRAERNRRALAANLVIAGASTAEKFRKIREAAGATVQTNHPLANADGLLRRIVAVIGVDLDDPEACAAWTSVAAMQLVRQWRRWGLDDDRIVAEAKDWAAHAIDRLGGPRAIASPARLHDWLARAARSLAAAAGASA